MVFLLLPVAVGAAVERILFLLSIAGDNEAAERILLRRGPDTGVGAGSTGKRAGYRIVSPAAAQRAPPRRCLSGWGSYRTRGPRTLTSSEPCRSAIHIYS